MKSVIDEIRMNKRFKKQYNVRTPLHVRIDKTIAVNQHGEPRDPYRNGVCIMSITPEFLM
jgi:hypothetical protein